MKIEIECISCSGSYTVQQYVIQIMPTFSMFLILCSHWVEISVNNFTLLIAFHIAIMNFIKKYLHVKKPPIIHTRNQFTYMFAMFPLNYIVLQWLETTKLSPS